VIQHGEFERLGSSHTTKVDVRIVATTNRDLEEEVRKGRFRQGERIKSPEAKLACLEVLALGGRARSDDAAGSSYFAARGALSKTLAEAAEYIVERGVAQETAPPLIRFIAQIAARFGVPVSEKAMAQSLPIVGAAGGALINTLFIDHFQNIGRGHFIVRRLERTYDPELVRREYLKLPPR